MVMFYTNRNRIHTKRKKMEENNSSAMKIVSVLDKQRISETKANRMKGDNPSSHKLQQNWQQDK